MHHSSKDESILQSLTNDLLDAELKTQMERLRLGATGEFPDGKLAEHDEGEIQFAVGDHNDKVIIEFGKPVYWVGMSPDQALDLAKTLKKRAMYVKLGAAPGLPKKTKPKGQRT